MRFLLIILLCIQSACCFGQPSNGQNFSLEEILKFSASSSKKAVIQLKQQGWKLIYSRPEIGGQTYAFQRLNHTTNALQSIQLKDIGKYNSFLTTVNEVVFDSLKLAARSQGFKDFYFQSYPRASDSAFLKDSSFVLIFRKNTGTQKGGDTFEVFVEHFSDWIISLMPQNAKIKWNKGQRIDFMVKCIGNQNAPDQLKNLVAACACGGGVLEKNYKLEILLTLKRSQLIELIKECFRIAKVEAD